MKLTILITLTFLSPIAESWIILCMRHTRLFIKSTETSNSIIRTSSCFLNHKKSRSNVMSWSAFGERRIYFLSILLPFILCRKYYTLLYNVFPGQVTTSYQDSLYVLAIKVMRISKKNILTCLSQVIHSLDTCTELDSHVRFFQQLKLNLQLTSSYVSISRSSSLSPF